MNAKAEQKTLIIIGGGAAGCFCAANIRHPDLKVIVLEKSYKLLSKVRISGGGRCNVTNAGYTEIKDFAAQYPRGERLLKKTLHRFSYQDTIQWFEQRGVPLKTEQDGRVFPQSDDSETIIDCILKACEQNKVNFYLQTAVNALEQKDGQYLVHTTKGVFKADFVCIAIGGHPKADAYQWFKNMGLSIEEPVPSLFTFNLPGHTIRSLMGVSFNQVHIKIQGSKLHAEGPLLITHWGLSGPAVLKLSAQAARFLAENKWQFSIFINWLGKVYSEDSLRENWKDIRSEQGNKMMYHKNPFELPNRFWDFLLNETGIPPEQKWSELAAKNQNKLIQNLCQYRFEVKGKTTFKEEFVTAGGVSLKEIQSNTFALKKETLEQIYIVGEVLDVDGITGGFNFQHAWSGGFIVAKDILKKVNI